MKTQKMNQYLVYIKIDNYQATVDVPAEKPQDAIEVVTGLLKEIEGKVGAIRVADKLSGYFIRGFS